MSRLRLNMTMSLDGYVAAPEQSAENPFGIGGMQLHEWLFPLRAFREIEGEEGGEDNASTPIVEGWFENIGATVMGRNMFGGGRGAWGADPWTGFWGDEPPYHHPVFVLTHHAREPLEMQGGTTFHFVTDGIESALEQATAAAAGKDVSLGGGATTVQQYMKAGLLDEMLISVVPVFLGGGARLFDNLGGARSRLEQVQVVGAPGVTHIRYRLAAEGKYAADVSFLDSAPSMRPQPLISVTDVPRSSRWYQELLRCESGHGGDAYERLLRDGTLVLQLHSFEVEHHHGRIGDPSSRPYGNGLALWFEIEEFDDAVQRAEALHAEVVLPPHRNPPDGPGGPDHRELWLRDPDGYLVVLASPDGESPWPDPRVG